MPVLPNEQNKYRAQLEELLDHPVYRDSGDGTNTPILEDTNIRNQLRKSSNKSTRVAMIGFAYIARYRNLLSQTRAPAVLPPTSARYKESRKYEWANEHATSKEEAQQIADRTGRKVFWAIAAHREGGAYSASSGVAEPTERQ